MGLHDGHVAAMHMTAMDSKAGEKKQEEDKRKKKVTVLRFYEGGVL